MAQLESFFWGTLAALGAVVIQSTILTSISLFQDPQGSTTSIAYAVTIWGIVGAAFIEEFFKYIVIVKRIDYLSLAKSYVVNSFLVGLGFFMVEIALLYFKGTSLTGNLSPLLEIGLLHTGTAGLIGYRIAIKNPKKISTLVSTLLLVTFIHSSYNLLVNYRKPLLEPVIFTLLGLMVLVTVLNFFRINRKLDQH